MILSSFVGAAAPSPPLPYSDTVDDGVVAAAEEEEYDDGLLPLRRRFWEDIPRRGVCVESATGGWPRAEYIGEVQNSKNKLFVLSFFLYGRGCC